MESVTTQDIGVNDLRWIIDYRPERCTMCGSCVASCTLNALEVAVMRQDLTVSRASQPEPVREHLARPVIRQKASLPDRVSAAACVKKCGPIRPSVPATLTAGMRCWPDEWPHPRRTDQSERAAHLDHIVGRISQMTDPALDSERHTFDILAPFGRVLLPGELPLRAEGGELRLEGKTPPLHWIYPVIFSDMSIGALSTRAWEAIALATAYLNEQCGLPVRMSSGEGGMPVKLLESERLKYMILQIASGHFGWNRIIKAMPRMKADPAGILIKIGRAPSPATAACSPPPRWPRTFRPFAACRGRPCIRRRTIKGSIPSKNRSRRCTCP
ncbi:MAG: glutamate synthase-related protein [Bilophila wadsworthia]